MLAFVKYPDKVNALLNYYLDLNRYCHDNTPAGTATSHRVLWIPRDPDIMRISHQNDIIKLINLTSGDYHWQCCSFAWIWQRGYGLNVRKTTNNTTRQKQICFEIHLLIYIWYIQHIPSFSIRHRPTIIPKSICTIA